MAENKKTKEDGLIEVISSFPQKHKVRLIKDHEDNGIPYKKGDEILVDDPTLSFLVQHGIIEIKNRS